MMTTTKNKTNAAPGPAHSSPTQEPQLLVAFRQRLQLGPGAAQHNQAAQVGVDVRVALGHKGLGAPQGHGAPHKML